MALTSEIYTLDIALSHVDRGVYESFSIKAAKHPSESDPYFVTRVLAYCLEYTEGIAFSAGGVSDAEWPAITVRDLTDSLLAWIEIGSPEPARLHKAAKASPRVAVYVHKNPDLLLKKLRGEKIHNADAIEIYSFDDGLLAELQRKLDRRMKLNVTVNDGGLYVDIDGQAISGVATRHTLSS